MMMEQANQTPLLDILLKESHCPLKGSSPWLLHFSVNLLSVTQASPFSGGSRSSPPYDYCHVGNPYFNPDSQDGFLCLLKENGSLRGVGTYLQEFWLGCRAVFFGFIVVVCLFVFITMKRSLLSLTLRAVAILPM